MGATIKHSIRLHAMPDDPAPAMGAGGCERVNRAFETVEDMGFAAHAYFKCLVIPVAAYLTCGNFFAASEYTHLSY
jgi:hypothetical protein